MSIRVLVADDHPVVREGLRGMITREADLAWVGAVADGHALVETVRATSPDVVLLDLRMPNGGGLVALRQLRSAEPRPACVVLSSYGGGNPGASRH
jgi:DNA-binding NarL/FixJ family response regulator